MRRLVECLGLGVEIVLDAEPPPALAALIGTLEPWSGPPALTYRAVAGPPPRLYRDERELAALTAWADLTPALELDLYRELAARVESWLLHAAALVCGRGALILAGASGAGKSTLTRALLGHGLAYLSEEAVGIDGVTCRGLRRPLHAEPGLAPLVGATRTPYPITLPDGSVRWLALDAPAPTALWPGAAPILAIVRLSHGGQGATGLTRLRAGAALAALWPLTLNPGRAALERACHSLATTHVFDLHTRTPADALAAALDLASSEGAS